MSEEAWESSVHGRELTKCGEEEKHDQSSRSSATTVNHTRAAREKERESEEGELERGRIESVIQEKQAKAE